MNIFTYFKAKCNCCVFFTKINHCAPPKMCNRLLYCEQKLGKVACFCGLLRTSADFRVLPRSSACLYLLALSSIFPMFTSAFSKLFQLLAHFLILSQLQPIFYEFRFSQFLAFFLIILAHSDILSQCLVHFLSIQHKVLTLLLS